MGLIKSFIDAFAWEEDTEKTAQGSNWYLYNSRSGARKVVCGNGIADPIDYKWLSQAKDKAIVESAFGKSKVYKGQDLINLKEQHQFDPPTVPTGPISRR